MRRSGSWARRSAIEKRRRFVGTNALPLGLFGVGIAGLLFLMDRLSAGLGLPQTQRSFLNGLSVGVLLGAMGVLISTVSEHYSISAGADAERWTSRQLRRFRKKGYRSIDNIEFSGFDIDHVAIGPAGVFAFETKWTSHRWVLTKDGIEGPQRDPIRRAQDAAHQIDLFLNKSKRLSLPIRPVLVIWGPGRPALGNEVTDIRGVKILSGLEKAWPQLLTEDHALTEEQVANAFDELSRFAKTRADYEWKNSDRRLPYWASTMLRWGAVYLAASFAVVLWSLFRILSR